MRNRWNKSDLAYLFASYGTVPTETIAMKVGRTPLACKVKANRAGHHRKIPRVSDQEYDAVIKAAAAAAGITAAAVLRGDRRKTCVAARHAAWTELSGRGYSQCEIAFVSGFTQQAVFKGLKRHKAKYVDKSADSLSTEQIVNRLAA